MLTQQQLTTIMIDEINSTNPNFAITPTSPVGIIIQSIAGVLSDLYANIDIISYQSNLNPYGSYLDDLLIRLGLPARSGALPGVGEVKITKLITDPPLYTIKKGDTFSVQSINSVPDILIATETVTVPTDLIGTSVNFMYMTKSVGTTHQYFLGSEVKPLSNPPSGLGYTFSIDLSDDGSNGETDTDVFLRCNDRLIGQPLIANASLFYKDIINIENISNAFFLQDVQNNNFNIFLFSGYDNINVLLKMPIPVPPISQLYLSLTTPQKLNAQVFTLITDTLPLDYHCIIRTSTVFRYGLDVNPNYPTPATPDSITVRILGYLPTVTALYPLQTVLGNGETLEHGLLKAVREVFLNTQIFNYNTYLINNQSGSFPDPTALYASTIQTQILDSFGQYGTIAQIIAGISVVFNLQGNILVTSDVYNLPKVVLDTPPYYLYYDIDYQSIIVRDV